MILYRKAPQLRVRRGDAPEPPFWCAVAIEPYSARRTEPVAIDYPSLRASGSDRLDVTVCDDVGAALERMRPLAGPGLIDATGRAERVFRRGAEALSWCTGQELDALLLVSTESALPDAVPEGSVVAVAAWPPSVERLEALFAEAGERRFAWGMLVPVAYPVTTDLPLLERLASAAADAGAEFLAAAAVELEPTAKQALATSLALTAEDDRYAMLFHARLEPLGVATERHVAALAAERGLSDSIPPPRAARRSNWNAAALLSLTATRMLAMELDVDAAGLLARAARTVSALDKPLARIAESASLSIVGGLDETSVEILTEWLQSGRSSLADRVAGEWRLRRA